MFASKLTTIVIMIGTSIVAAVLIVSALGSAARPTVTLSTPAPTVTAPTGDDLAFPTVAEVVEHRTQDARILAPRTPGEPRIATTGEGLVVVVADGTYHVIPWEATADCTILPASDRSDLCELLTDY